MPNTDSIAELLKDDMAPHPMRAVWLLRISHLLSAPVAVLIAVLLLKFGYGPISDSWDLLPIVAIYLVIVVGIILMLVSANWIRAMRGNGKWPEYGLDWIVSLSRRYSFFLSVNIFGIMLAYVGVVWPIWLALIISSGVVQIFTYPSDKRLREWITESKKAIKT